MYDLVIIFHVPSDMVNRIFTALIDCTILLSNTKFTDVVQLVLLTLWIVSFSSSLLRVMNLPAPCRFQSKEKISNCSQQKKVNNGASSNYRKLAVPDSSS